MTFVAQHEVSLTDVCYADAAIESNRIEETQLVSH